MIVFDLSCGPHGHRFEGWFRSSDDFARQQDAGLLMCPECGTSDVGKAVMAPAVQRKGNQVAVSAPAETREAPAPSVSDNAQTPVTTLTPEARAALETLAKMQQKVIENSRWVGGNFAEEARAMHYGERDGEAIHGQATREEVESLVDEGVEIAPLPFPIAPPDALN